MLKVKSQLATVFFGDFSTDSCRLFAVTVEHQHKLIVYFVNLIELMMFQLQWKHLRMSLFRLWIINPFYLNGEASTQQ